MKIGYQRHAIMVYVEQELIMNSALNTQYYYSSLKLLLIRGILKFRVKLEQGIKLYYHNDHN